MISLLKSGQLPNKNKILILKRVGGFNCHLLQISAEFQWMNSNKKYNNGNYLRISNINHSCPATTNFLSQSSVKNTSLKVILHQGS